MKKYSFKLVAYQIKVPPIESLEPELRKSISLSRLGCEFRLDYYLIEKYKKLTHVDIPSITKDEFDLWLAYLEVIPDFVLNGNARPTSINFRLEQLPCEVLEHYEKIKHTFALSGFQILVNKQSTFGLLTAFGEGEKIYILAEWQSVKNKQVINLNQIMDWIMEGKHPTSSRVYGRKKREEYKQIVAKYRSDK